MRSKGKIKQIFVIFNIVSIDSIDSFSLWLNVVNMEDCTHGNNLAAFTSLQMIEFLTGVTCGLTIDVNTRCI